MNDGDPQGPTEQSGPAARERTRVPSPHDPTQAFPRVEPPKRVAPPVAPAAARRSSAPPATRPTERLVIPEAAPRTLPPPAPGEPRRSWWKGALLALAALAAIGAAVVVGTRSLRPEQDGTGGVSTDTPDAKYPPQKDVALDGCRIERDGVAVDGTVRNPTDDPADYVIDVQLVDPTGAVITTGSIATPAIAPDTRTPWAGTLPPSPSNAPSGTCKIVKVNRHDTR